MTRFLIFTYLAILFIGCAPVDSKIESNENAFDPVRVEQEVRSTLDDYFAAVEEKGLLGEFDYLDDSDEFYWVPPGYQSALDFDSVATILRTNAPTLTTVKFEWINLEVYPLTEQYASYTGRLSSTTTDTSGKNFTFEMLETGIVVKRPEGWKILSGQSRVVK